VLDPAGTADVVEEARNYALFVPIILAVLCGMRRGETAALRWRTCWRQGFIPRSPPSA
jgi:integrase